MSANECHGPTGSESVWEVAVAVSSVAPRAPNPASDPGPVLTARPTRPFRDRHRVSSSCPLTIIFRRVRAIRNGVPGCAAAYAFTPMKPQEARLSDSGRWGIPIATEDFARPRTRPSITVRTYGGVRFSPGDRANQLPGLIPTEGPSEVEPVSLTWKSVVGCLHPSFKIHIIFVSKTRSASYPFATAPNRDLPDGHRRLLSPDIP